MSSFQEVVELIAAAYLETNSRRCPWDPACGRNLKLALARLKDWTLADYKNAIGNKFMSEENHSQSPKFWLGRLEDYLTSPLDRYHVPMARPRKYGPCAKHPLAGLTQWGGCWDCYVEKHSA